jgi:hypothetical protein
LCPDLLVTVVGTSIGMVGALRHGRRTRRGIAKQDNTPLPQLVIHAWLSESK